MYTLRVSRPLFPCIPYFLRLTSKFTVTGHTLDRDQDKLVLFLPDGGVRELSGWSRHCEIQLGADWVLAQKRNMESQAGQPIPINVNA